MQMYEQFKKQAGEPTEESLKTPYGMSTIERVGTPPPTPYNGNKVDTQKWVWAKGLNQGQPVPQSVYLDILRKATNTNTKPVIQPVKPVPMIKEESMHKLSYLDVITMTKEAAINGKPAYELFKSLGDLLKRVKLGQVKSVYPQQIEHVMSQLQKGERGRGVIRAGKELLSKGDDALRAVPAQGIERGLLNAAPSPRALLNVPNIKGLLPAADDIALQALFRNGVPISPEMATSLASGVKVIPPWTVKPGTPRWVKLLPFLAGGGAAAAGTAAVLPAKDVDEREPNNAEGSASTAAYTPAAASGPNGKDSDESFMSKYKPELLGAGAGLAGTTGTYALTGLVPGLKKKKILRAMMALTGGAGIGYGTYALTQPKTASYKEFKANK